MKEHIIEEALAYADALIKELDRIAEPTTGPSKGREFWVYKSLDSQWKETVLPTEYREAGWEVIKVREIVDL